jgi:hypothetical protein
LDTQHGELSYEPASTRWYNRRRFHRWTISLAAVLLLIWVVVGFAIPIWQRYRFYQLQQRVATYSNPPNPMALHFSATQPYAHVPGPVDQFYASFWNERPKVQLGRMTIPALPGAPTTPVFCGTLKTVSGQRRIVQVYATPGQAKWSPMSIELWAVSCELQGSSWVLSPSARKGGEDFNMASVTVALNPPYDVVVSSGTVNASDPSEADVSMIVNGRMEVFKLHVVDLPPTPRPGRVGFAVDFDQIWVQSHERGWMAAGMWEWPFTGK